MFGFLRDVVPYPDPAGVRWRLVKMPVRRPPEPEPAPGTATRRDGTACDWRKSCGLAPAGPVDPMDRVRDWTPVTR